jgi:plastocyanin
VRVTLIAVLVGAALLSAVPAEGAGKKKTVTIGDNYYAPDTLKVKKGTTVVWRWPSFEQGGDVHDVKLGAGRPKGAKKFQSEAASTDYTFKRKLTVPGKYKIVCTLHEEMRMTIRVRK